MNFYILLWFCWCHSYSTKADSPKGCQRNSFETLLTSFQSLLKILSWTPITRRTQSAGHTRGHRLYPVLGCVFKSPYPTSWLILGLPQQPVPRPVHQLTHWSVILYPFSIPSSGLFSNITPQRGVIALN